uniref:Uncharacterized protein n=1 Tax=Hemiselmis tepida TaxID=464990 RepID=A0A7S0VVM9_9CRYP|mmetsp:Transcript_26083/g.66378  ORF Transcript_26083/g.66378 Transcript_26083/m.66378 type:complete len:269 (+) Transcript_26083:225-1031(+)|eukprot:CAMPEP_0174927662 /NCGR_PEP_ID=MMETSP1355-20121228/19705_1 /TAXON_ID=464990 /ORGANISM="Hemiselmis tepida, Strain CCMP443" /LENGTH=268 /DNA_ID=CAMNT_0016173781 /DNA_START=217 /DNA_END=1023 /DNA_ORIENTATION=-
MPPKEKAVKAPPNEKAIAARAAAEAWKPTPFTHISFIRGFDTVDAKNPLAPNPSILFDAVAICDYEKVKQCLLSDGNVDSKNPSGSSLTHVAVRMRDVKMLELIMAFHPNIDVKESVEVGACTPLHLAAEAGDVAIVAMLLKNGASPRMQNAVLSTPLHIAASKGNHDVVKALLDAVNLPKPKGYAEDPVVPFGEMLDGQGKSAHYWAKEYGHDGIAELLPPIPYDPLAQMDIKKAEVKVWNPNPKKPKKDKGKKKGDKKDGKGKKKK